MDPGTSSRGASRSRATSSPATRTARTSSSPSPPAAGRRRHSRWRYRRRSPAVGTSAAARRTTPPASPRGCVLTVGNSFSRNATRFLGDLATATGHVLIHHLATIGGAALSQHWKKAQRHEDDPEDPLGLHATKRSLKLEPRAEPWDFITLQQASIRSHDLSTIPPYARDLFDYVKRYAPQAEVLVHQTRPYRRDHPRFAADQSSPGEPVDQEAMSQGLTAAYRTIAAELGTRLIPVGESFHRADTDPT